MSDESKTPVDDSERCRRCGRELTWVKAGTGVPVREPDICLLARDESWAFCAGERRGWVQLVYVATRPPFDAKA